MNSFFTKPFTFDRVVRLFIVFLIISAMVGVVYMLREVLLPFLVACVVAYILEPVVQFLRRCLHIKGRGVPVLLTLALVVMVLVAAVWLVVPPAIDEMHNFAAALRQYSSATADTTPHSNDLMAWVNRLIHRNLDLNDISDKLGSQEWKSIIEQTLTTTWSILSGSVALLIGVFNWLIVVLYLFFIMIDYDKIKSGIFYIIPPRGRAVARRLAGDVALNMNRYFRGQTLVATLVGILFAIGFWIIGLPMAVVMGLFIGLLNLVPYLQLISVVPVVFLCLVSSVSGHADFWVLSGECIIVYAVVQVIQDFILTPRIMGKTMGLNPAVILLSLSIWGTLLGLIGLIIALPLTTLLFAYYKEYVLESSNPADDSKKSIEQ